MNETIAILGPFLAGLVFLYWGLERIGSSLRSIAGPAARRRAATLTGGTIRSATLGFLMGLALQSTMGASLIVASFVSVGVVAFRRALIVTAWVNPGTAVLPFLAAIDLNLVTVWLIGIIGLLLRNRRISDRASALGAILGVGLVLLAIVELKAAGRPIPDAPWFPAVSALLAGPLPVAFAIGALLRMAIQSSSTIVVVVIVLSASGMVDADHAYMVIAGTGVGTGLTVLLFGRAHRGEARRVGVWQASLSIAAALVFGLWSLLGAVGLVPMPATVIAPNGLDLGTQLAVAYLLQMILCSLLGTLLAGRAEPVLRRLIPDRAEDELARPAYLDPELADSPDMALELAAREQLRALDTSRRLLDPARDDHGAVSGLDVAAVRSALGRLDAEIADYLAQILRRAGPDAPTARLVAANVAQQQLHALREALDGLAAEVTALPVGTPARDLGGMLVEAADLIVSVFADAVRSGDPDDRAILLALTADRGAQLAQIRERAAAGDLGDHDAQASVLLALGLLERVSFLARSAAGHLTEAIPPSVVARPAARPPDAAPLIPAAG